MGEHPLATAMREAFAALDRGDPSVFASLFAEEIVWHVPGTNAFSGRFDGRAAVLELFQRLREAGVVQTYEVHDVIANDDHVVALVHVHLENKAGQRYDQPQVQVWHASGRTLLEFWAMNQDQAVVDALLA